MDKLEIKVEVVGFEPTSCKEYNKHIYHKFSTVLESALAPTHELLNEKQGLGSNSLLIFPRLHRKRGRTG